MNSPDSSSTAPLGFTGRALLCVSPAIAVLAPIIATFARLSISMSTRPSMYFAARVAALGLSLGIVPAILAPGRGRGVRSLLYAGALTFGVLVVLDITFGGHRLLGTFGDGLGPRIALLAGISCAVFALLWLVRSHAHAILLVMACVLCGSTAVLNLSVFATPARPAAPGAGMRSPSDKPPIVYIVMDEAMGTEGLDVAPGGVPLADALRGMFLRHQFFLHGGAFSQHFVSARSIPDILNFDFRDRRSGPFLGYSRNLKVSSALFDRLHSQGYQVVVYDTPHIDFCFSSASRCETLHSFDPFSPYLDVDQDTRAVLFRNVMRFAFVQSYTIYHFPRLFLSAPSGHADALAPLDAYDFPKWFDQFGRDVMATPRGRAYFAHLLMPHAPYVLDQTCRPTGRAAVGYFLTEERGLTGEALADARARTYADYEGQYMCAASTLDRFLAALDARPEFQDATIVVQGDHGSRISAGQYATTISDEDMVDNYSALYAIRRPDIQPGSDMRKISVQRLTAEYFSGQSAADLGPDDPDVAIDALDGTVVGRRMPNFSDANEP